MLTGRQAKRARRGVFISFEGGEGCGKTTQSQLLLARMVEAGESVLLVKEPGSTPLGNHLRQLVKGEVAMSSKTELLLFIAARAELVATVVQPALERRVHVIADRYSDSTAAYQGYGRRMSLATIEYLNRLATDDLKPDLTFLLDVPPEKALGRTQLQAALPSREGRSEVRGGEEGERRFEGRPLAFHQRVLEGYRRLASAEPGRWCVLDGTQPLAIISEQIWERVRPLLKR